MIFLSRKKLKVLKQLLFSYSIYIGQIVTLNTYTSAVYLVQASLRSDWNKYGNKTYGILVRLNYLHNHPSHRTAILKGHIFGYSI